MKKFGCIVFDLDGTLLDSLPDLHAAVNVALERYSYPTRTIEEVRNFIGNGVRRLMRLSAPSGEETENFEEMFAYLKEYYSSHLDVYTKPYDGIMDMLKALSADGRRMCVVSNKYDSAAKYLCEKLLSPYIEIGIGESESIGRKPDPATVFAALDALGQKTEDAVYIGDTEVDIATAKNSGIPCISVSWGFRSREELKAAGAEVIADTPEELLRILSE